MVLWVMGVIDEPPLFSLLLFHSYEEAKKVR